MPGIDTSPSKLPPIQDCSPPPPSKIMPEIGQIPGYTMAVDVEHRSKLIQKLIGKGKEKKSPSNNWPRQERGAARPSKNLHRKKTRYKKRKIGRPKGTNEVNALRRGCSGLSTALNPFNFQY